MTAMEAIDALEEAKQLLETHGIQGGEIYERLGAVISRMRAMYAGSPDAEL